ncbi:MAG: carboxypeptidase regulatory-like domain-containing protein, partial [Myxococcales bacterium]|nr:carboxypeptidase regulatory-like domain-containing protein [Myxococcales bacterium]
MLLLWLAGCADVPATNPHDPQTPADQQASGQIVGRVRTPDGFDAPSDVAGELLDATHPSQPVERQSPRPDGAFAFTGVAAGVYTLVAAGPGLRADPVPVRVPIGGRVQVGDLALRPVLDAFVVGRAERGGAPPDAHGGIAVQAVGTPFTTQTADDGRFRLPLGDGVHTLRFRAAGYELAERTGLTVGSGETLTLDEPVVLRGAAARIRATVTLTRYETPRRLQATDVRVRVPSATDDQVTVVRPDAEGEVVIDGLAAGPYRVEFQSVGYATVVRTVTLAPGEDLQLGTIALLHRADTDQAVPLAGRLLLAGSTDHGGTTVRARLAQDDLPFGQPTVTDADGRFEIAASPDERYVLQVVRAGFATPGAIGPLAWHADDARFEDDEGAPVERLLERNPIDGRVGLSIEVAPGWVPEPERFATVRLEGPVAQVQSPVFSGSAVSFDGLPAGDYVVYVQRPGFVGVARPVRLDDAHPEVDLGAQRVELADLGAARLDLGGATVDACDLVGLQLRGADLSGVRLRGDL